jgi:hypothetical protein
MANEIKTRQLIENYLLLLDKEEYMNIYSLIKSEVGKQRIVDTIYNKMMSNPKLTIEDVVSDIELSLYE